MVMLSAIQASLAFRLSYEPEFGQIYDEVEGPCCLARCSILQSNGARTIAQHSIVVLENRRSEDVTTERRSPEHIAKDNLAMRFSTFEVVRLHVELNIPDTFDGRPGSNTDPNMCFEVRK